jgi:hypothetical protein
MQDEEWKMTLLESDEGPLKTVRRYFTANAGG